MTEAPAYEVVVLAGGTSRRFGSDKLALLLDRTLAGVPAGVPVVCVGPPRPTPGRPQVRWVREDPAGSGPLAAAAAALTTAAGVDARVVVLLGGDMPSAGRAAPALVAALAAGGTAVDAVLLADGTGRSQLLASAWWRDALVAALGGVGDPAGVPLQRVLDQVDPARLATLPDRWGASYDVDTPADLDDLANLDAEAGPEATGR